MGDYITNEDTIIFSPEFNLPLNPSILINYKKIIFSDYELTESLFDAYSNSNFNNQKFIGSKFNQSLSNSLCELINLTHNNFGYDFNQSLSNSLCELINLTHINFGNRFNQSLSNSLDGLINLTHINFGNRFNEELDIPHNIISIIICCNNQYIINNLPDSIEELELDWNFNLELNDLPSSIKKIIFNQYSDYNKPLNNLPKVVELLVLPFEYNLQIINIPRELKKIICSKHYKFIDDFSNFNVETY
jgi:hypothetical protein